MRKVITYILISSLIASTLIGCGKKEENTANSGPVIIQAGDSAEGSGGKKDTATNNSEQSESIVVNNDKPTESKAEDNTSDTKEINLVGVWMSNKGNCIEFRDNVFTAYLNGKDIGGEYTLDSDNLTITYAVKTELENVTEEQKLLGNTFTVETVTSTYSVQSYTEQQTFILGEGNNKEVYTYFGEVAEESDASFSEITDAAELEELNKELEANGINPETGLPFENEQKLIEMGIDPSTGLPLEVETTEEATETEENKDK